MPSASQIEHHVSDPEPAEPAPSSSLDPVATTVEKRQHDAITGRWRFRHAIEAWTDMRQTVSVAILPTGHAERFLRCGTNAWLQRSPSTGKVRVCSNTCKLRWCPACRREHAARSRRSLTRTLESAPKDAWKFLTLTVKHSNDSLGDQVKHLRTSFRRMRQRKLWKSHYEYGVAVLEISFNASTECWHPHLHVLLRGTYVPQKDLSREWLTCTRGSPIVDIRVVRDPRQAVHYVTKYLTKPPSPAITTDPLVFSEYANALHGMRLIAKFGNMPEVEDETEDEEYPTDWEPIAPLHEAIQRARHGDEFYQRLLTSLERSSHECIGHDPPSQAERSLPDLPR